ncbi:MAG: isochorismatase family protein [Bryobacteraceae bacterium]
MRIFLLLVLFFVAACLIAGPDGVEFHANLRSRVQPFKNSDAWQAVTIQGKFATSTSALVICDMWDKHWCGGATRRVEDIARRMDPLLKQARAAGILVIHSPSDTITFYQDRPQRKLVLQAPRVQPPPELSISDPPLPIDDSDGGCDTPGDHEHQAWKSENPILSIGPNDAISDNGEEIYSLLHQKGIHTLFVMGVHANMCILNRTFAIRQMSKWGIRCVLVRDLTDAMYNPARRPFVSHAAGTELVIEHIEKYWCPSILSADLMAAITGAAGAGGGK